MNRNFPFLLTLALLTAAGRIAAAPATNSVPVKAAPVTPAPVKADAKMDFQSFHLVTDRNIFDMSRTGARLRPSARVVHVDEFTLIGTMSYEKGQFAFFDGSSSDYRQTHKAMESIAGFKITAIGSDYVDLQATNNNKTTRMVLGAAMRREDKGPWSLSSRATTTLAESDSGRSRDRSEKGGRGERRDRGNNTYPGLPPASEVKSEAASNGGTEDDVIKRLMQKRAKEVSNDQ